MRLRSSRTERNGEMVPGPRSGSPREEDGDFFSGRTTGPPAGRRRIPSHSRRISVDSPREDEAPLLPSDSDEHDTFRVSHHRTAGGKDLNDSGYPGEGIQLANFGRQSSLASIPAEDLQKDEEESYMTIASQVFVPFIIAGIGMVGAGFLFDSVQVCVCALSFPSNF